MTQIIRCIDIDASPDAVFRQLIDLHRLTTWSTITDSHDGPEGELALDQEFDQSIRVAGVKLPTHWRCVELDPPNLVVYEATSPGGGRLHMRQTVHANGIGSRVDLHINYDLPGGPIGNLLDKVYVERRNQREAEHSLNNLKDLLEGRPIT